MIKSFNLSLSLEDEMILNIDSPSLAEKLKNIKITVDTESGILLSLGDYLLTSNKVMTMDQEDKIVKGY
jgi:hypothetical protein